MRGFSALMRHSMAWPEKVTSVLLEAISGRRGDADLLAHEVEAGDHLGHGMLDLEARVHLDEIELAVLVEEFDGADAEIAELAHRAGDDAPISARAAALRAGEGASSQDLLVAALQRAVALAEMDDVAVAVGEHLDFDVARLLEIFLDVDGVVAERGLGFGAGGCSATRAPRRSARPSCRVRRRRRRP